MTEENATPNVGPLTGTALDQHKTLLANPEFQAALSGRGGVTARENALRQLEDVSKSQADASGDPVQRAAANRALSDVQRAEAIAGEQLTGDEVQRLHALHTPSSPMAYLETPGLSGEEAAPARQMLFEQGVSPMAAKQLQTAVQVAVTLSDEQYGHAVDSARDIVRGWPGGPQIIADAVAFLNGLTDSHPLAQIAEAAAIDPRGIAEMARLYRARKAA